MRSFIIIFLGFLLILISMFIIFELIHFNNKIAPYLIITIFITLNILFLKIYIKEIKAIEEKENIISQKKDQKKKKKLNILINRLNYYASNLEKYNKRFIFVFNNRKRSLKKDSNGWVWHSYFLNIEYIFEKIDFKKYKVTVKAKDQETYIIESIDRSKDTYMFKFKNKKYFQQMPISIISIERRQN